MGTVVCCMMARDADKTASRRIVFPSDKPAILQITLLHADVTTAKSRMLLAVNSKYITGVQDDILSGLL